MNLEQPPQSTRFNPALDNACDDTPMSRRHQPTTALRIILADDHPVVLRGTEMALSGSSWSIVAQAQNADELIAHLKQTPCDLLVSDYSMPYGSFPDGLALMGYLRRHYGHIPLIVMTMLHNPSLLRALSEPSLSNAEQAGYSGTGAVANEGKLPAGRSTAIALTSTSVVSDHSSLIIPGPLTW
ncbi:response regulator [Pseudomonas sp. PB120]|nr:response regulator [Pseudomonas sp. PB120]